MSFFVLQLALPGIVHAVYVRPNEISIERPYIERHIQATSIAFGLNRNATERPFAPPSGQPAIDPVQDATLLENVRLWDLRAYNATIGQIQACDPTTHFLQPTWIATSQWPHQQVLLSPREIDVNQLSAEASQSWINPRFIYTHGFGVVMSEVNKITPDGLPVLLIENAPPEVKTTGFQLTRPEILFRRQDARSVFRPYRSRRIRLPHRAIRTIFDLPGHRRISCWLIFSEGCCRDFRGRAQHYFHRLSHRREPHDDSSEGAGPIGVSGGLLHWDQDPYLVITDDGKLVWMVDGYTTSLSHPYSATLPVPASTQARITSGMP